MKAIWVNTGAEVSSYPTLHQLEFTHVFFDLHRHTKAHLTQARNQGFKVGGYTNPQWFGVPAAKDYRDMVNRRLSELVGKDEQCDVQFNIEKATLSQTIATQAAQNKWVDDLFYWWRRVRATRETSWTMEGHQGGWFTPTFVSPNLKDTTFVPQAYDGNMNRWDSYGVVKDLVDYGVPFSRIMPFYDTPEARIPYSEGFFYLENRLY